jgi:hypothetical protein
MIMPFFLMRAISSPCGLCGLSGSSSVPSGGHLFNTDGQRLCFKLLNLVCLAAFFNYDASGRQKVSVISAGRRLNEGQPTMPEESVAVTGLACVF